MKLEKQGAGGNLINQLTKFIIIIVVFVILLYLISVMSGAIDVNLGAIFG